MERFFGLIAGMAVGTTAVMGVLEFSPETQPVQMQKDSQTSWVTPAGACPTEDSCVRDYFSGAVHIKRIVP